MTATAQTLVHRLDSRLAAWLGVGALGLVAYRGVLDIDASAGSPLETGGAEDFLFEPSAGSPLLILGVCAWMLWRRRVQLQAVLGGRAFATGAVPILAAALALGLWSHHVGAADLLVPSLMLVIMGGGALLGGREGFRIVRLPALFLLFALPIPAALLNELMYPLQLLTGRITEWLLSILGIPAQLIADRIFARGRIFQVIETCSGLRLMATLTMAAVVYAELLSRSRLHMLLLVLIAPLVGIAVNAGRVLSIVLNPYAELSTVHTAQGLIMLVVGVLIVAGIDRLLEFAHPGASGSPPTPAPARPGPFPSRRLATFAGVLAVLAISALFLPRWPSPPATASLASLPSSLGEWRTTAGLPLDQMFLGSVGFSQWIYRAYHSGDESVDLMVASSDRLERYRSLRSPKTAIAESGWSIEEDRLLTLDGGTQVRSLVLRSRSKRVLVHQWYEGVGSLPLEALRGLLALDRGAFRREGPALAVRLSTPLSGGPGDRESAEARLSSLEGSVRTALDGIGASISQRENAPRS